uniref:DUF5343 domain-containing protein n=1 Tax=mine drainage metagenome TaxID=410659 RepID=E6PN90_9ZZZZ
MSGTAGLVQAVAHLRRSFPAQVSAETLKKLGIAPNNETYVLNILRFIGVLDAESKKNAKAVGVFNKHDDAEFQAGFAELVKSAYVDLFGLHGDSAWSLPTDKLISYFRNTDHTSAIVGQRQASTFQALASLSGKNDGASRATAPKPKRADSSTSKTAKIKVSAKSLRVAGVPAAIAGPAATTMPSAGNTSGMALTVRVEINLPAGGDQETYNRIFKSIRENLLNGNVS